MTVHCDNCGAVVAGDQTPLSWVVSVEDGETRRYCERCARENLRAIEAKLDQAWW